MKHTPSFVQRLERYEVPYAIMQFWSNVVAKYEHFKLHSFHLYYTIVAAIVTVTYVALCIAILVLSIAWGSYGSMPGTKDLGIIAQPLASEVYAADSTLLGRYYLENRSNVKFEEISPNFIQALLATEDARFFQHRGIDFHAWGRVFFKSLILNQKSSGGGSTITQQLAKNLFPREDHGRFSLLINKIKEVIIAKRLERLYTKGEILEIYLNTVPFSENTFGIKVAASRFFDTTPGQLNPSEAAVLVGMLKATSSYNPVSQPERSIKRRNLVLDQMAKYYFLAPEVADSLKQEPLNLKYRPLNNNKGLATYFREHLRLELKDLLKEYRKSNGMAYNIYTDGLKIYTTIDAKLQSYAEASITEHMLQLQKEFEEHLNGETAWENDTVVWLAQKSSNRYKLLQAEGFDSLQIDSVFAHAIPMKVFDWNVKKRKKKMSPLDSIKHYLSFLNAGFLAINPKTGKVKAWAGGINHEYFKYDHIKSKRSVGSTFKPIVYAKAIQQGIHPCNYTPNQLRTYWQYEGWRPRNADNRYGGFYSMEGGLINSVNTVTVSLAMRARPWRVAELAQELGISEDIPGVPAIALGAMEVSLKDMVNVYGTFANRGVRPELNYIRSVETPDGNTLINFEQKIDTCQWKQVLTTYEADIVNEMLQSAVNNGTGRRLRYRYQFENELAGKTGTSQNHSDGWFIGYNPNLVAGVWVGAESPNVRFRSLRLGQGANTALPVFANFIAKINNDQNYQDLAEVQFPEPSIEVQSALKCANIVWPEANPEEGKEEQKTEGVVVAAAQKEVVASPDFD